jgi:predicted DNA-binding transcriptional regulator
MAEKKKATPKKEVKDVKKTVEERVQEIEKFLEHHHSAWQSK